MIYSFQEHLHLPDLHLALQAGRAGAGATALRHVGDDQQQLGPHQRGRGRNAKWKITMTLRAKVSKNRCLCYLILCCLILCHVMLCSIGMLNYQRINEVYLSSNDRIGHTMEI